MKHTNLFQVVKTFLRIPMSEQWIQRSLRKIFLSNLQSIKSAHSIKICLTVIVVLDATQTGGSCFFLKKGMRKLSPLVNMLLHTTMLNNDDDADADDGDDDDDDETSLSACPVMNCPRFCTVIHFNHGNSVTPTVSLRFHSLASNYSNTPLT